jgi:hypothetical protein
MSATEHTPAPRTSSVTRSQPYARASTRVRSSRRAHSSGVGLKTGEPHCTAGFGIALIQ